MWSGMSAPGKRTLPSGKSGSSSLTRSTVLSRSVPEDTLAPLLERAVQIADGPTVRTVVLLGSLSRGEATAWSDVDIERWVESGAPALGSVPRFLDGRLLAISTNTVDDVFAQLELPDQALWAVPAYRAMRVLVDRSGDAARMAAIVARFDWDALRPKADRFVSLNTAKSAEFVLKIRSAAERRDEWAALHAAGSLIGRCARIMSVARGTFITTENEYYRVVCEAAGERWASAFRGAFALDGAYDAFAQANAACRLFAETARLVDDRLDAESRDVVLRTLALVHA